MSRRSWKKPPLPASRIASAAFILTMLALVAASPVAIAATASPASSTAAAGGSVLRVGFPESPDSLNPFAALSGISWEVFNLGYNQLTTWDQNLKPAPDLAASWTTSSDGKVWTFKIRSGVTWHDGVPLTAHDVAYTYNLIKRQQLAAFSQALQPIESITAPDETTLVVACSHPYSGMLALDIPIIPEHIWSKVPAGKLESWPNTPFVGSGPYRIADFKRGSNVKLVAYDDYRAGTRPSVHEVDLLSYTEPTTMVMDYQSGTLDAVTSVQVANFKTVAAVPGSKAVAGTFIGFAELGFNCWNSPKSKGNPLLLDERVRQAIHWAVDKNKMVDTIMFGQAQPGTSILSPIMPWHWQPPKAELVTYDPAKARQILDQAGYVDRNGDGIREAPNGAKLSFRLTALNEYPDLISAAKMIHSWLAQVGIQTRINTMAEAAFYDVVYGSTDDDMYLWMWGGGADPNLILSAFTTAQIKNWSDCNWSNKEYDRLYQAQTRAIDVAQRQAIIDRMQKTLYESSPYVVLWYTVRPEAWRTDRFTGWRQVPPKTGIPLYNYTRLTYVDLKPAAEQDAGVSSYSYWMIAIPIGVVAVGGWVWWRRRSKPAETE